MANGSEKAQDLGLNYQEQLMANPRIKALISTAFICWAFC
jgi:hypothetical protein